MNYEAMGFARWPSRVNVLIYNLFECLVYLQIFTEFSRTTLGFLAFE